jgi:transposase InsO family protein
VKRIADTLEVSRSNQYEQIRKSCSSGRRYYRRSEDDGFLSWIRKITDQRPTYGYRRVTAVLNRYLEAENRPRVNHKRVYRIMKINGLLRQRYTGRPVRSHDGTVMTWRSNRRWCSDVFEIVCWNAQRVRVAFTMDCCEREIISYVATTAGISGDMIRDLMAEAIESRFGFVAHLPHEIQWLSDNGAAYTATAHETRAFARMMGLDVRTTPFHSPESNGMAEAFIKTFKRDYVHINPLNNAITVMEQLPTWFDDYNSSHPHKALKMKSPREYRELLNKLEGCPVS